MVKEKHNGSWRGGSFFILNLIVQGAIESFEKYNKVNVKEINHRRS
jgi:hypothetical protein